MNSLIYLRPLLLSDAKISFKWRNDPQIWTYTAFTPTNEITEEIEENWLAKSLNKQQDKRFAVCVRANDQYIGNVQLLDIHDGIAEFQLFIGEKDYWGKGIGFQATLQMLDIAFNDLHLKSVFLTVHPDNIIAMRCYSRAGFKYVSREAVIKMVVNSSDQ